MDKKNKPKAGFEKNVCNDSSGPDNSDFLLVRSFRIIFLIPGLTVLVMLFLAWSIYSLYLNLESRYISSILLGVIFLILGSLLGVKEADLWSIEKKNCTEFIRIPRSNSSIVLLLISVILKIFWAYLYFNYLQIPGWMYLLDMILSSLVIGFIVAQLITFFKRYVKQP